MKKMSLKKTEWYRFEQLCKLFGLKVEVDATYTYSNLVETQNCYIRIMKKGAVICIADLID